MKSISESKMQEIMGGTTPLTCFKSPFNLLISLSWYPSFIYEVGIASHCWKY